MYNDLKHTQLLSIHCDKYEKHLWTLPAVPAAPWSRSSPRTVGWWIMMREYGVAVRRPVPAHATSAAVESAFPMTCWRHAAEDRREQEATLLVLALL